MGRSRVEFVRHGMCTAGHELGLLETERVPEGIVPRFRMIEPVAG